jgi:DNA polymerase-4
MLQRAPLVEPLSIDEAFLDLTDCQGPNGASAAETLVRFAKRIERENGVTVSVGLSYCKFLAKLASDLEKPRGFPLIRQEEAKAWLAPQGKGGCGGGKGGAGTPRALGFSRDPRSAADRRANSDRATGDERLRLWRLAQGRDDRSIVVDRDPKSISSETTFDCVIDDKAELTRVLPVHCDRVAARLRKAGLWACGLTLKLRLPDFRLRTRSRAGIKATQLAPRQFELTSPLLDAQPDGMAYRRLGIAATELAPASGADEDELAAGDGPRAKNREAAIACLRDKFGPAAVQRGRAQVSADAI